MITAAFLVAVVAIVAWSTDSEHGATSRGATTTTAAPSGATTTTAAGATTTTKKKSGATTTTVPRSNIKVQVANGSGTAGVATRVTQTLQTQGWNTLPPVNASSQVATSSIYYAANRKPQALEIASELQLPASAVQPLTTAVPVAGGAGDDVVVVVGPNLATA